MTRYLLSVWYPANTTAPSTNEQERITRDVDVIHRQLPDEGSWVFGSGLHDPTTATVVESPGGRAVTTDGPFVETKEVLGGFSIIDVPDLDMALTWAERTSQATTCPIEVRPLHDEGHRCDAVLPGGASNSPTPFVDRVRTGARPVPG